MARRFLKVNREHYDSSLNPFCVKCRCKMSRSPEKKRNRVFLFFRCKKCGTRVLSERQKRGSHIANCVACRRPLVANENGKGKVYLRCLSCKTFIAQFGKSKVCVGRRHLASCVQCHGRMCVNRASGVLRHFYCPDCKVSATHVYKGHVRYADSQLLLLIDAYLPKSLHPELREEVATDLLLELLKSRRRGGGYGLNTATLNSQVVNQFIKKARKRLNYGYGNVSLFAGEFPLIERLHG